MKKRYCARKDLKDRKMKIRNYKPVKIKLKEISGMDFALKCARFPKKQRKNKYSKEENMSLGSNLVRRGPDHAKALRGIRVHIIVKMQVGFMIEFETYRHGVECLSTSSSMHNELKSLFGHDLAEQKQRDLPKKYYKRGMDISYQALRAMYIARRRHKHPDWQIFCNWIETLEGFSTLIYPEFNDKKSKMMSEKELREFLSTYEDTSYGTGGTMLIKKILGDIL